MKTQKMFISAAAFLLSGGILFITGCTNGMIKVAALQPVPLLYMNETNKEALKKLQDTKIAPEAISQAEAIQYILSRDIYAKFTVQPDTQASAAGSTNTTGNSANGGEVNEQLGKEKFSAVGALLKGVTPVLNSRYAISNLADLYEWRIANETLFKLQDIFGSEYSLYYVPAIISISPGNRTYKDFFARVTFEVTDVNKKPNIHLLALSPVRQFDNRSESLSRRTQLMLTLMGTALAKAGAANLTIDAYYSMLKRVESDFSQVTRVPVVTSFVSDNRLKFGWDIYPSPAIAGNKVADMMIADTWRFAAIIAIKDSSLTVKLKPSAEWIRLPRSNTWLNKDRVKVAPMQTIELEFPKPPPQLTDAVPESDQLIKLSGKFLNKAKTIRLIKTWSTGKKLDEIKFEKFSASSTLTWLVLKGEKLEDKKSYLLEVSFPNKIVRSTLLTYNAPKKNTP